MKIAVVENLPPGGQKRVLYEQVKRLSENHDLDLYTLTSNTDPHFSFDEYVNRKEIFHFDYPDYFPANVLAVYTALDKVYRYMAETIDNGKYDAALVTACTFTQAPYVLKYLKIPSIYYCSEPKREFYENIPRRNNRLTYALTYPFRLYLKNIDYHNTKSASKILTISGYSAKYLSRVYGMETVVNYPGIDGNKFYPLDERREKFVLSVGNFNLLKGHDFIIRSLSLIPEKIRPKLIIAGYDGTEKKYLNQLSAGKNVPLELWEGIEDEKLNWLYNKASLFVYAPLKEPFGLVVLEALAAGLKVVAVDEGGVPEIISDTSLGYLADRNEKDFAGKVMQLLKQKETNKDRKERSRKIIQKWNWEKSVRELEEKMTKINE